MIVATLSLAAGAAGFLALRHFTEHVSPPRAVERAEPPPVSLAAPEVPEAIATLAAPAQPSEVAASARPTSSAPHASIKVPRDGGVARPIELKTKSIDPQLDAGAIAREIARLRPRIEACYAAPECSETTSPWCIDSKQEKVIDFKLFIDDRDGHVDHQHSTSGGMHLLNCVSHALDGMRLPPYKTSEGVGFQSLDVELTIK